MVAPWIKRRRRSSAKKAKIAAAEPAKKPAAPPVVEPVVRKAIEPASSPRRSVGMPSSRKRKSKKVSKL